MPGRAAEPADLADVLERGSAHVRLSHVVGVGLPEGLNAAAHANDVTPGTRSRASRTLRRCRVVIAPVAGDVRARPGRADMRGVYPGGKEMVGQGLLVLSPQRADALLCGRSCPLGGTGSGCARKCAALRRRGSAPW